MCLFWTKTFACGCIEKWKKPSAYCDGKCDEKDWIPESHKNEILSFNCLDHKTKRLGK